MLQKLLTVRLPIRVKTAFANDCSARGLCQRDVIESLINREMERIRKGRPPSYAQLKARRAIS